ncbi:hypothetical protein Pcinc_031455 [Petrolisthes cinctipes]|uniref:Uncharacterized protein n=1 Tax=Petrolisthes cinctipes TaxID=88211 RepID=A0AAE1EWM0_PETCI|nr:hypothetical protein Pcinc_031455 [Petrolisthes cinctipes]
MKQTYQPPLLLQIYYTFFDLYSYIFHHYTSNTPLSTHFGGQKHCCTRMATSLLDQNVDDEETIRYWIFPQLKAASEEEQETEAEELVARLLAHLSQYTHQYLWNNQPFMLRVQRNITFGVHLMGSTRVGDYLEDEWFIVYMLMSLTRHFPGLVCR